MRVLLVFCDGDKIERDVTYYGVYYEAIFQGMVVQQPADMAYVMVYDCPGYARRVFILNKEKSYQEETGNLPVYCETPWVLI